MAKKARKKKNGASYMPPIYRSYVFRDKEPVIDMTRTLFEDVYGEKVNPRMLRDVASKGGPSAGCMAAWFFGKTRRPANATIEAAGRALGHERVWRRMK